MVLSQSKELALMGQKASDPAIMEKSARVLQHLADNVLAAARDDLDIKQSVSGENLHLTVSLITLNRAEFKALASLLNAAHKGYGTTTVMALVEELVAVFRP